MRQALGPIAANVLLTAAGGSVLLALGWLEFSLGGIVAGLGLAFMTGVAVVGILLLTSLVAGVPYGLLTIASAAIIVTGVALGTAVRTGHLTRRVAPKEPLGLSDAVRAHWAPAMLLLVALVYALVGLRSSAVTPLIQYDSWAMWTKKAILLTDFHHLPSAFFVDPSYLLAHQDYPLLVPLLESIWFRFAGTVDTQAVHVEFWLLLVGFVWAAGFVLYRQGGRILVWGPVLLLAALATGTTSQLLSAYADIPMALFAGLGLLLLGLWLSHGRARHLILATILLSAAANTKSEAAIVALLALLVAGGLAWGQHPRSARHVLLAIGGFVIAVLPWHVWLLAHGVPSDPDVPLSKVTDLGYLFARTGRIWPAIQTLGAQLGDQTTWSYVLPLGCGVALMCLIRRVATRAAAFYLITGLITLALYVFVYWLSPVDIHWYLETSGFRVVDVVILTGLAAALHLPQAAADELGMKPSADPPAAELPLASVSAAE